MKNADIKKAAARCRLFHGRSVEKIGAVSFPYPKAVILLGTAYSIEYLSDKKFGRTRKVRLYNHKMGAGVKIFASPCGKWLYLAGGKFKVTDWLRG